MLSRHNLAVDTQLLILLLLTLQLLLYHLFECFFPFSSVILATSLFLQCWPTDGCHTLIEAYNLGKLYIDLTNRRLLLLSLLLLWWLLLALINVFYIVIGYWCWKLYLLAKDGAFSKINLLSSYLNHLWMSKTTQVSIGISSIIDNRLFFAFDLNEILLLFIFTRYSWWKLILRLLWKLSLLLHKVWSGCITKISWIYVNYFSKRGCTDWNSRHQKRWAIYWRIFHRSCNS